MVTLRPVLPADIDALYEICLLTGDAGADASALYTNPRLLGQIYAAPYAALEPAHTLVAEDAEGVAGYLVGTHDTAAFAARLERDWWPGLRQRYADTEGMSAADRDCIAAIMRPEPPPADLAAPYPAHIHMNLLPRLRGQGIGTALLRQWLDEARRAGVPGVHLGASTRNTGGVAFWTRSGFIPQRNIGTATWFGMAL